MRLLEISDIDTERLTLFLLSQPESMLYHSVKYQKMLVQILGCKQRGAIAVNGKEILGFMPVMETQGTYGRVLNSLPFYGSHGGLLACHDAARQVLAGWFHELVTENGVASATTIENPLMLETSIRGIAADYVDERIAQFTPLNLDKANPDKLMASLHSKTRNMVRKADLSGIIVDTDAGQLPVLARIHSENMRAMSASPKPERFFELVPQVFQEGEEWQCWVGRKDGEVVAALLVFYFNGITEYFTPAVREEHRSSQALSLVIFEAIRDSARRGMRWWNWGATWRSQESVYRFKSRWGTVEMPYRYRTVVRNTALLSLSQGELLEEYPYFYVLPFGVLNDG